MGDPENNLEDPRVDPEEGSEEEEDPEEGSEEEEDPKEGSEEEEDPEEEPEDEGEEFEEEDHGMQELEGDHLEPENDPMMWEEMGNLEGWEGGDEELFVLNLEPPPENGEVLIDGQLVEPELGVVGHVDHEEEDWNLFDEISHQFMQDAAAHLPAWDSDEEVHDS